MTTHLLRWRAGEFPPRLSPVAEAGFFAVFDDREAGKSIGTSPSREPGCKSGIFFEKDFKNVHKNGEKSNSGNLSFFCRKSDGDSHAVVCRAFP